MGTVRIDRLPPCIHTDCESLVSEDQCYGVLGCNWCSLAPDGYTSLANPFCARQEICYSGILSSLSPLSDETKKFHRDRYRDFFSRPKFSRLRPRLFFETKCFRDRYRDFFSRPNVFETDAETFFETKCFRDRYRDFF